MELIERIRKQAYDSMNHNISDWTYTQVISEIDEVSNQGFPGKLFFKANGRISEDICSKLRVEGFRISHSGNLTMIEWIFDEIAETNRKAKLN